MKKELSEEDQANAQRRAQAEGMRTRGLAAFARPISSVALCATVYTKGKKSAQQHHIDEIQEGEVVLAPWIDKKHEFEVVRELVGRKADTISFMRKKGKVSICAFKEEK